MRHGYYLIERKPNYNETPAKRKLKQGGTQGKEERSQSKEEGAISKPKLVETINKGGKQSKEKA